ncbi:MAG: ArsR family transcriptional regulator [Candidatus Marsarchaeota archaeon]|jgi:DNA-binding transcriptional ArsR family regulator|nr:ArsR family transcriptional regulator [Candidatus Marsarchaeota archaeon]MCL5112408.1 ArsR family transcriptional regulator [Candidatus Marsarchaeota archaeon]
MAKNSGEMLFGAISNAGRFRILEKLLERPMTVSELTFSTKSKQTLMSHNLKCLLDCMIVRQERMGKYRRYYIDSRARPIVAGMVKYMRRYEDYLVKCNRSS